MKTRRHREKHCCKTFFTYSSHLSYYLCSTRANKFHQTSIIPELSDSSSSSSRGKTTESGCSMKREREREKGAKKGNHIPVEGRKRCSANLKHLGESLRFPCEPSSTFSAFLYPNTVRSKRTALRPPYFGNLPDRERKRGGEKERDTRVTKKKFNCSRLGITVLSQAVIRLRVLSLPPPPASIIRPRSV